MSNVLSFASALQKRSDEKRLTALRDAGMHKQAISIATLAANSAFTESAVSLEEAAEMGFEALKYLTITTSETADETWVVSFLSDQLPVLHYLITDSTFTHDWHEVESVGVSLADDEHAPQTVRDKLYDWVESHGYREVSNYGFFALQFFYLAAASELNPLHLQYFPKTGYVGLVLYDRLRNADVALIANIHNWRNVPPTAEAV